MAFKDKVRELLMSQNKTAFSVKQLFEIFGVANKFGGTEILKAVEELCSDGEMIFDEKSRKYKFLDDRFVIGEIQGNAKGFGFCIDEKGISPDLFIPRKSMHGAFHKDRVLVKKVEGTEDEGQVVKVLQRGMTQIVGRLDKRSQSFVIPDEKRFASDIYIPQKKTLGAKNNQKVVVKITHYPFDDRCPEGEIVKVIGFMSEKGNDIISAAYRYGLECDFPKAVSQSAATVPQAVSEKEIKDRKDFRNIKTFTIDGKDARDLDDAVSIQITDSGLFRLGVHIADVSHYVRPNSVIDKEAFERGTSVYFPDKVFPMLPVELSNGICSLNPKVDRLTLSCVMDVDKNGKVVNYEISPGVIKTVERMNYDDVFAIMQGDKTLSKKYANIKDDILLMKQLAEILIEKRKKRGCMDFETKEVKFAMDEKGRVTDILPYERNLAHKMIEEFMILANETVAEFAFHCEIPFVYRVHEKPDAEKLTDLNSFLNGFGLGIKEKLDNVRSATLQKVLDEAEKTPYSNIVSKVMLRSMQKAKYYYQNLGHFGLASECYCHFTSPIRRYPDLVVHRAVKNLLKGGVDDSTLKKMTEFVKIAATHSSEREKLADEAERDVDDMKKAEYAKTLIGREFDGIVSGVTSFGIFVELPNTVEGLIRLENLPEDYYVFDEKKYTLFGKRNRFTLSQKIKISVAAADPETGKIDFDFVCVL